MSKKFANILQFILIFLLPLLFSPINFNFAPFEYPKVVLGQILILVLLAVSFFSFELKARHTPLLVLIFISVISYLHSSSKILLFGNQYRWQGSLFYWYLLLFSMIISVVPPLEIKKYLKPLLLIQLIFFLGSIFLGGDEIGRAIGTMGEPNSLALMAVFYFAIIFNVINNQIDIIVQKKLFLSVILFIFCLLTIFLSGSRSGLVAFGAVICFYFCLYKKQTIKKAIFLSLIILLIGFVLQIIFPTAGFENRTDIWQTGVYSCFRSGLIGQGFGNNIPIFKKAATILANNLRYQTVDSAHNIFLDICIQGGWLSLLIFCWLIAQTAISLLRQKEVGFLAAGICLIAGLFFNPASVVSLIQMWWIIGIGLKYQKP